MNRRYFQIALALALLGAPLAFAKKPSDAPGALCAGELATTGQLPEAVLRLSLDAEITRSLNKLHRAATDHENALSAFAVAPADPNTRKRYETLAKYATLFQSYLAFARAAEESYDFEHWSDADRATAREIGMDRELASAYETAHADFEKTWARHGEDFIASRLGTVSDASETELAPVRIQFADRTVADFFARCRAVTDRIQNCAGRMSWSRYARLALRRLELINGSHSLEEVRSRTKELKLYGAACRYAGYYAIEIDHQYRLIFHWDFKTGSAVDVFIEDYHAE